MNSSGFFFLSSSGPVGRIRNNDAVSRVNSFMRKPAYILLLALLTVISNLLCLDIYLYTVFIAVSIFVVLFSTDLLPLMPIVILCYIAPSPSNNPGSANNHGSVFYPENGGIYLIVLASLFVICLLFRLFTDSDLGGKAFLAKKRPLLSGMLILSAAYLLSGVGMAEYGSMSWKLLLAGVLPTAILCVLLRRKKASIALCVAGLLAVYAVVGVSGLLGRLPGQNLLFALIQCAAVTGMYYLFAGAVNWELTPKWYLAWVGMCAGFVVLPQLLENYFSGRIFMEGTGTIDRELIYAGWGMHNNIGGMMTFMLPFPFYLACTRKKGWIYNLLGTILMLGIIISCSRGSMVVATAVYALCIWLVLKNKAQRKANLCVYLIVTAAVIAVYLLFFRRLMDIFALFFEEIFIMSERDNLVGYGFKQFLSHPLFGGSFFPQGEYVPWDWSTSEAFSSFFPPRWHNTIIQMLASCGIVGLGCYLWHRWQTVKLFLTHPSKETMFIGLFVAALLLCSLMDCHFFNVGPVLFYSMALAYAENIHHSRVEDGYVA